MRRLLTCTLVLATVLAATTATATGATPRSWSRGPGSASTGSATLHVSEVDGLDPAGQTVTVSGSGYDESKGVYVSLCVIPPPGSPPSPCGGGEDREGTSGASAWISSNPPDYAAGLTTPYGPGGTFTVSLRVSSPIAPGLDCTNVRCAVVTRNDHTRSGDRSQDVIVPVTFGGAAPDPGPGPAPEPEPEPVTTTTEPEIDWSVIPPTTDVAADGLSVSDGSRTVHAAEASDLDPEVASVEVSGEGFDPEVGIYVALCRIPEGWDAPGPCTSGDGAAWISSNPPDYGLDLAVPFDDGGRFAVTLELAAVIDADTDCRVVACALSTRADDTAAAVRNHDLLLPVTFAAESVPTTSTTEVVDDDDVEQAAPIAASISDDGGSGSPAPWLIGTGLLVVVLVGVAVVLRRRGAATSPTGGGTTGSAAAT